MLVYKVTTEVIAEPTFVFKADIFVSISVISAAIFGLATLL